MNQTSRTIVVAAAVLIGGAVLLVTGVLIGRLAWWGASFWPLNMLTGNVVDAGQPAGRSQLNYPMGPGMMGGFRQADPEEFFFSYGMMSPGMMGGFHRADPDEFSHGFGMMGGIWNGGLSDAPPLDLEDARAAVQDFLDSLGDPDLVVGEVMIFDNHAYAQIVEEGTGIGAMEVLVDPLTKAVNPEHGPNMMWNLKYSPMSGQGMTGMMGRIGHNFGRMMGGLHWNQPDEEISAEMPVIPEDAVVAAQEYLDYYLPGAQANDHADAFYGYYTLHILKDDQVMGMLSINGFTGQVFPHTWHGNFVEMDDGVHE